MGGSENRLLCGPEAPASEVLGWRRLPSISFILTENKSFSSYAGRGHMCALAGSKTREGQATKKMHASLNSKDRKRTRTRGPEAKPQPPAAPADGVGGGREGRPPIGRRRERALTSRPRRQAPPLPPRPPPPARGTPGVDSVRPVAVLHLPAGRALKAAEPLWRQRLGAEEVPVSAALGRWQRPRIRRSGPRRPRCLGKGLGP